jgi:hypothetical protein
MSLTAEFEAFFELSNPVFESIINLKLLKDLQEFSVFFIVSLVVLLTNVLFSLVPILTLKFPLPFFWLQELLPQV